jgi:hypothetical protein
MPSERQPSGLRQQARSGVLAIFVPSETQCDASSICGLHFSLVPVHPGSTRSARRSAGAQSGRVAATRARDTRIGAIGRSRRNATGPAACQGRTGCNGFPGPSGVQRSADEPRRNHRNSTGFKNHCNYCNLDNVLCNPWSEWLSIARRCHGPSRVATACWLCHRPS